MHISAESNENVSTGSLQVRSFSYIAIVVLISSATNENNTAFYPPHQLRVTLTEPTPIGNKRHNTMDLIYNAEWTKELAGSMTDDTIAVQ